MQHRPLLGQVLPGREPRGLVTRVGDLLLGSGAEHARPRLVRDAGCGKVTRLRRRPRPRCGGFPPADGLQRRHPGALRRAAPDREGQDRRAAPRPPQRRRGLPAPDRAGARRGCPDDAPAGEVRGQVRDRAREAQVVDRLGRRLRDRRGGARRRRRTDRDRDDLERARIEAGVPAWRKEIDETRSFRPRRVSTGTHISFTKGCYPGQEPVARLHYRGHANRGLRVLRMDAEPGAEIRHQGKAVGRVTERRPWCRPRLRPRQVYHRTPSSSSASSRASPSAERDPQGSPSRRRGGPSWRTSSRSARASRNRTRSRTSYALRRRGA